MEINSQKGMDRRADKRYEGVCAEYKIVEDFEDTSEGGFKTAFIRNFSVSGVSLHITEDIPNISHVRVHLFDPDSVRPINFICGVVWERRDMSVPQSRRERYNIGLKILVIDKPEEQRLYKLADHFERLQHKGHRISDLIK